MRERAWEAARGRVVCHCGTERDKAKLQGYDGGGSSGQHTGVQRADQQMQAAAAAAELGNGQE